LLLLSEKVTHQPVDFDVDEPQTSVDILSIDLILVSEWNGQNYGVINKHRMGHRANTTV